MFFKQSTYLMLRLRIRQFRNDEENKCIQTTVNHEKKEIQRITSVYAQRVVRYRHFAN